jgi:hypothetical protein
MYCLRKLVLLTAVLKTTEYSSVHKILGGNHLGNSNLEDREGNGSTTHNIDTRQTSMPPARFELTIPASERPQTYAFDHAATGIGSYFFKKINRTEFKIQNNIEKKLRK